MSTALQQKMNTAAEQEDFIEKILSEESVTPFNVAKSIMKGSSDRWNLQSRESIYEVLEMSLNNHEIAAELLAQDNAVYQLIRFGQGESVMHLIQNMDDAQKTAAMSAYESFPAMLEYDRDATLKMFSDLSEKQQKEVIYNNESDIGYLRNYTLLHHALDEVEAEIAAKEAAPEMA